MFPLHILDILVIVACLAATLALGWFTSRGVKGEGDFFLGGRKMGKWLQFFLNFGNMADSTGAPTVCGEVYRQGVSGVWLSLQALFVTPFYWFSAVWFRRVRLTTMADLFIDRFGSKPLATAYVLFNIYISLLVLAFGNVISYKVVAAMMIKPESGYTQMEKQSMAEYHEFRDLSAAAAKGELSATNLDRLNTLEAKSAQGKLNSFISYIPPLPFYIGYTLVVAVYITMGGLRAAAVTDALQSLLILLFTCVVVILGLMKVGGFEGLHQMVPKEQFDVFGGGDASDYSWLTVFAITLASLVQIFGLISNMQIAGSARDEATARFGQICGAFAKRLIVIAWAVCGLLAIGLLSSHRLTDSELTWGYLNRLLLSPGLLGLVISGMLLGHMPAVGANAVAIAALLSRNVYEPLIKGKSAQHYLGMGKLFVLLALASGIILPLCFSGAVKLLTLLITFNCFFGAVVLLIFFWRKLSATAVWISLVIWIGVMGVSPALIPQIESLRRSPLLLARGNTLGTTTTQGPALYFDAIQRSDPEDLSTPQEGIGRFRIEVFILSLLKVPVAHFDNATIFAARWLVSGILPLVLLIIFSILFPARNLSSEARQKIDIFYAKLKTPVAPTEEEDNHQMQLNREHPHRFDGQKLLPGTQWEFGRWKLSDIVGFFGCWAIAILILEIFKLVLTIGAG